MIILDVRLWGGGGGRVRVRVRVRGGIGFAARGPGFTGLRRCVTQKSF